MAELAITAAPSITAAETASGDLFPLVDISAEVGSQGKSIELDELRKAISKIAQVVWTVDATQKSTTSGFPTDDTIPQNTEGASYDEMNTTITPTNASSLLIIEVQCPAFQTAAGPGAVALFRDSTADAIATGVVNFSANFHAQICLRAVVSAGSTSATTFKVRFSRGAGSGLLYLNDGSTPIFGGTMASTMKITEVLP